MNRVRSWQRRPLVAEGGGPGAIGGPRACGGDCATNSETNGHPGEWGARSALHGRGDAVLAVYRVCCGLGVERKGGRNPSQYAARELEQLASDVKEGGIRS